MKGEKERIDRLLDKHVAEQLAKVDWDRLTDDISTRLDQVRQIKQSPNRYPALFKLVAGVAALIAVIFTILIITVFEASDIQTPDHPEIADKKGVASVWIKDPSGKVFVTVRVGRPEKEIAKCHVDIIDHDDNSQDRDSRATWSIISAPRRAFAGNGYDREEEDLMCLL